MKTRRVNYKVRTEEQKKFIKCQRENMLYGFVNLQACLKGNNKKLQKMAYEEKNDGN